MFSVNPGTMRKMVKRKCVVTLVNTLSQLFTIVTTLVSAGRWVIAGAELK